MSVYYSYILELAQRLSRRPGEPQKLLDYGCGAGEIVTIALGKGFDAYGVDLFYAGGSARDLAKQTGLWDTRIFDLRDTKFIPMDNASFDVVVSNQVFEHIDNFTLPLDEIDRVLKPGGIFIDIFPSDCVWREGHIGIPFVHWLPRNRMRVWYTLFLRTIGFGYAKQDISRREWAELRLKWIDAWTYYKPLRDIKRSFERHFSIEYYEADYLIYRFEHHRLLKHFGWLVRRGFMKPFVAFVSNRLACHVFVLRKPLTTARQMSAVLQAQ